MRMERRTWMLGLVLVGALALAACGDGKTTGSGGTEGGGTTATEGAPGKPIHIGTTVPAGAGVRLTLETKGTISMSMDGQEREQTMDMTMVMVQRCERHTDDGGRVMVMKIEKFDFGDMPGAEAMDMSGFDKMHATMTIGADGKIADMTMDGVDPQFETIMKQMVQNGGITASFPSGPDGLRIGDTIDVADVMPMDVLNEALASVPGAEDMSPEMDVQGGYTLRAVRDVDGVEAAEFAVDMTIVMTMDMGDSGSMETRIKTTGTQLVAIATGLPAGESTLHQVMDMSMTMDRGGETTTMTTHGQTTATSRAEQLEAR